MAAKDDPAHFLAKIRAEALLIDPNDAEVWWDHREVFDPYDLGLEIPLGGHCVGREYFARRPGSDIWVCFRDLPDNVYEALWKKHARKMAFPAGLFGPG